MPPRATPVPCSAWQENTASRSNFECENGECGSCAVQVSVLERKQPLGVSLTEKEKTVLKLSGRITKDQIAVAETDDIPPPWRLACQFIVRNEDILVNF